MTISSRARIQPPSTTLTQMPPRLLRAPRHARVGEVLDVLTGRTGSIVLEDRLPDPEPATAQVFELYAAGEDVASVLAILDAKPGLSLYLVQILSLYKSDLADVSPYGVQ